MKKYCFIIFIICSSVLLAQEFKPKWSHGIAGGASFCLDQSTGDSHDGTSIKYNTPGYVLFYRLIENQEKGINCITVNANYRSGSGYSAIGGNGASNTTSATLNWCRVDVGLTRLVKLGRNKDFSFGPGLYIGGLVFAGGNAEYIQSNTGVSVTTKKSPQEVLNPLHFGVNLEFQHRIDITETDAILLGIRFGLETPEGFGMLKFNKLANAYLGYQFGKIKKPKEITTNPTEK